MSDYDIARWVMANHEKLRMNPLEALDEFSRLAGKWFSPTRLPNIRKVIGMMGAISARERAQARKKRLEELEARMRQGQLPL